MWQDVATPLLRYAINDVDLPQRYADARIQQAWLVGATYVVQEFSLFNTYTVDIANSTINPDPTPNDPWTVNLTTLRSSLFMIANDLRLASNSAFMIKDVNMVADLRDLAKNGKILYDEAKQLYDEMRAQYMVGVNPSVQAILTPINILAGGYRAPIYGYDVRDRMIY